MDRTFLAGAGLSVAGLCGYVVGTLVTYPGRAFSLTAIMVGITLAAIGDRRGRPRDRPDHRLRGRHRRDSRGMGR
ncbi:hypothetical protein ACFQL0_15135 [Haloplanus litoreus]|uniref:hypothetical protein n=1 Tax=Haloplanus litoreus TaxID=767515 RepID=UPI00361E4044